MIILSVVATLLTRPLCLALILAAAGLTLLHFSRGRAGAWLIAIAGSVAYLASTSMVGDALLAPLVGEYPVFEPVRALGVRDIVVLGSSYAPRDRIPVTGALDPDGLARIVEGVRLARSRPGSRLLVSGGAPPGFAPSALGFAQMAADLGIERSSVVIMDRALDTSQEARDVAALLGHAPFILVTSAFHMPRAMRLMHRAGADPVPAPTGQSLYAPPATDGLGLVPGSRGLRKTEAALHEYLGLAAVSLRID